MNNASISALLYHSLLVHSAWLNTNPVNLEVSANTPGKDYPLRSPIWNAMSFPKDNHWNSQTFDWSTWRRAVRPLMWTMCSLRAGRGRAGPGLLEQLLTISSSMREMHTERDTPRHTKKHTLFPSGWGGRVQLKSKVSLLSHGCCMWWADTTIYTLVCTSCALSIFFCSFMLLLLLILSFFLSFLLSIFPTFFVLSWFFLPSF